MDLAGLEEFREDGKRRLVGIQVECPFQQVGQAVVVGIGAVTGGGAFYRAEPNMAPVFVGSRSADDPKANIHVVAKGDVAIIPSCRADIGIHGFLCELARPDPKP